LHQQIEVLKGGGRGPADPRFPYGSESLKTSSNTILIVEGEKKCDAARSIFPDMTVISWIAGAGSVHRTDWSALSNRKIVLWPDHDEPKRRCMAKLKSLLEKVAAQSVRIVSLPSDTPQGWDLANVFPEGWDRTTLNNLINEAV
jgi:putative DNA primase/helicase